MKVKNLISSRGNKVVNQFIIKGYHKRLPTINNHSMIIDGKAFQSYDSTIALKSNFISLKFKAYKVYLDKKYWNYSVITSKYRNIFLNETTKETKQKIEDGVYKLVNLN